jgi:diguanylate cyclase (GGDEF)-like protein
VAAAAAPHEVARFGGEELALGLEARKDEALALAERLRQVVAAAPVSLADGAEVAITVSVGVATIGDEPSAEALLRGADDALLAAKARGRDRVVHLEQVEREALERDLPVQAAKLEDLTRVVTERVAAVLAHHGRRWFEEIRGQAEQDALTGLYTRRYFDQRLRAELEASRGGGRALAVALLDVDHFGQVNKTHGWPAGDLVLAEIAARVAGGVRAADWVARYGGEELAIVLHELPAAGLAPVLERVRQAVRERPIALRDGTALTVTVSIGAAVAGAADDSVTALLERVSAPLLAAKRAGRDRVCVDGSPR